MKPTLPSPPLPGRPGLALHEPRPAQSPGRIGANPDAGSPKRRFQYGHPLRFRTDHVLNYLMVSCIQAPASIALSPSSPGWAPRDGTEHRMDRAGRRIGGGG